MKSGWSVAAATRFVKSAVTQAFVKARVHVVDKISDLKGSAKKGTTSKKTGYTPPRVDPSLKRITGTTSGGKITSGSKRLASKFNNKAERIFSKKKATLLNQVLSHKVSQELLNHTEPSAFLGGKSGTLFGLMGFKRGDDPVGQLVNFLNSNITLENVRSINSTTSGVVFNYGISIPSISDIRSEPSLALPWESGHSWATGIEEGISGLPYYVYQIKRSRSGEGAQSKNPVNAVDFQTLDFLTPLLEEFRKGIDI